MPRAPRHPLLLEPLEPRTLLSITLPTSTTLTSNILAPVAGQAVTLTAHVETDPALGPPQGTITFHVNAGTFDAPLVNGSASLTGALNFIGLTSFSAHYTPTSPHAPSDSTPFSLTVSSNTILDILVLYTPQALAAAGNISTLSARINTAFSDANTAYANSKIPLTLRKISQSFINYSESGSLRTDLIRLQDPNDGYLDLVPSLRSGVGADLVVLIDSSTTSDTADGVTQNLAGIGSQLVNPNGTNRDQVAFSVLAETDLVNTYVLAHEVGHNLGAAHAIGDPTDSGAAPYAHGYRFTGTNQVLYHDIMAYAPGQLIPYFSSPTLTYQGVPLGNATTADAARTLRENAPAAALFRTPQPLGSIDQVTSTQVSGWAYDPRLFDQPATVRIDVDGVTRATFSASVQRADLASAFGSTPHGFTALLPALAAGAHIVSVYAQDAATGDFALLGARTITSVTPLFDESYYLANNPDVAAAIQSGAVLNAWSHFQNAGQFERRNPSAYFDTAFYLQQNPDLASAAAAGHLPSPFAHYLATGQFEGRRASPYFDERFYRLANPDVAAAINAGALKNGLEYFLLYGQYENRTALPYFNAYQYEHASGNGIPGASPYSQFLNYGNAHQINPSVYFDNATYLALNPDVAAAVNAHQFASGLDHYLKSGRTEGRNFSTTFSESSYRAHNPDVNAAILAGIFSSGFEHYLLSGRFENRTL